LSAVKVEITPEEKASRVEIIIRFLYMIPLFIVMYILALIAYIAIVVNFITSLLLGKRIQALNNFMVAFMKYQNNFFTYLFLTDERPEIMPKL